MKTILSFIAVIFMMLSTPLFADKISITGEPVVLEQSGDVYTLPEGYTTTNSYYYVSVNGAKQVCYLEKQPSLLSLEPIPLSVRLHGETVKWSCYPYDDTHFQLAE